MMKKTTTWLPVAVLGLLLAGFGVACSSSSDDGNGAGGSAQGGSAQGGSAQGGSAQGGSAQGGSAQGGSAQGGSAQGGSAGQGGSAQGGSAGQGGSAQGGSAGQGGSAQGGSAGQGGASANCTEMTLKELHAVMEPYSGAYYLNGTPDPALGDSAKKDMGSVEFYEDDTHKLAAGTFDLSKGGEENYATCMHCVRVTQDFDDQGKPAKTFFQKSGTLELTKISSPFDGLTVGKMTNIVLEEVTIDPNTYKSTPVAGGACLVIKAQDIDTDTTGDACTKTTDCTPNICDPADMKCKAPLCDSKNPCADTTKDCAGGICLPKCVPFDDTHKCAAGQECIATDMAQQAGVCRPQGTNDFDKTCDAAKVKDTDCKAGSFCGDTSVTDQSDYKCIEECNFFAATAACSVSGQYCSYGGWCWKADTSAVAINAACPAADDKKDCAVTDGIAHGYCVTEKNATAPTCRKWCRTGTGFTDCGANEKCEDVSGAGLGLCLPTT